MKINTTNKELIKQALNAQNHAYAPYSNFHVGAAIIDEHDNIHAGCNVENSAYPLGECAESSAIAAMILAGGKLISKIVLVSSGKLLVTPCGGCRQKIQEFSDENTQILVYHQGEITKFSMKDLLPHSFDKQHL
ncbi:MAG: cytidine deaminase [Proteobacteria bacterium]|nr:cytidine deaminase [Pseudomonadota bacterium]